jgi:hypothetical protein
MNPFIRAKERPVKNSKISNFLPSPVTNVYKNSTIRIQKGMVSERVNIRKITPFNQTPFKHDLGDKFHTIEYELKR